MASRGWLRAAISLSFALAFASATTSSALTLSTDDQGWYRDPGDHVKSNTNYVVATAYRNFFVFDLAGLGGSTVSQATLVLPTGDYSGTPEYILFDVTTPVPTLTAGGSDLTGIYADLAAGVQYSAPVVAAGSTLRIDLNSAALAAINGSIGGPWALAGAIPNPLPGDVIFSRSRYLVGSLELSLASVPEPGSALLLGTGLLGISFLSSRL